ncbi:sterol regulatory element-binding protein cleavage-activating protein isoform X2 [Nematostella vectensis]|uniref:sterol regulatory element-binding protein cleavage-activating protein isoform X2 n=1 Tax=Nematostella vectensis TaxID=45351 RepID=UPI0020778868|nr:sterol regulatory element-binding protein cleavage-activating protein isoform X2 [Nematostella vectensis]
MVETTLPWFAGKPLLSVLQFVITVKLKPWNAGLQSNEVLRVALKPAFLVTNSLMDYQKNGIGLPDMCLHVASHGAIRQRSGLRLRDSQFLPAEGCLLLSPANLWNKSLERFEEDDHLVDDLYQEHGRPAINIALKEFIFGVPLKHTGLHPQVKWSGHEHNIRYAVTLMLNPDEPSFVEGLRNHLWKQFPGMVHEDHGSQVVHIYYKGEGGSLVELGPISVAYFVVFLYLAFSVAKIDMVKSKWGLAFSAVITVIASLIMAAGLCTMFGLVPTLNSSEIFPYLVIMIGVENILVITKSVVSTPVDLDVKHRVAQGLSKEGKYMLKNLLWEILVLGLGYLTYVHAIQEFALFALVGLLTDFFLQVFMFATILSIDIRRMELSDIQGILLRQRGRLHSSTTEATSNVQPVHLLPPLPPASVKSPGTPHPSTALPLRKSKRLEIAYFWASTRIVQKALMVFAVMYFLYMVFFVPSTLSTADEQGPNPDDESLIEKMIREAFQDSATKDHAIPDPDRPLSGTQGHKSMQQNLDQIPQSASWTSLSNKHWPQLLSYYDISLVGRYISLLPAVHIHVNINTLELASSGNTRQDPPLTTPIPPELVEAGSGDEAEALDPEYYLNALYCVLLGMLAMIILFFICKYLNDLQISPRIAGRGRRTTGSHDELTEAVPMRLIGHPQNVEHVICTLSGIVSICLSGEIRVWDRSSGDCLRVVNRMGRNPIRPRRRRRPSSRGAKRPFGWDEHFTTARYFESLVTQDADTQENPEMQPDPSDPIGDPVGIPVSGAHKSTDIKRNYSGSFGSSTSAASGFDFSPYCQDRGSPGISPWPWSSDEESSVSEGSCKEEETDGVDESKIPPPCGPSSSVWCLDCRGDILATGCSDGSVELWSLSSGRQICVYCENRQGVTSVTFLPNSPQVVVARLDGTLDFLTLISPTASSVMFSLDASPVKRTSSPRMSRKPLSPESGTSSVSGDPLNPTHASPTMCSLTHRVRAHHQPVSVLVASEGRVVTGSHDRTLKVFRTDHCVRIFTLHGHRDGITELKVDSNNPDIVISGASNGGVRVWDLSTGECLQHLRGHTCAITTVASTHAHLISVSIDNSMCVWERSTGKCLHYNLRQIPDLCSNVAMLTDNLFVTGGQGVIVVWDLLAGKPVKCVSLGNGDSSVFVRNVLVCDTATVVCEFGKDLRVVTFPFVTNKAE